MRTNMSYIVVTTVAWLAANTGACTERKETGADGGERPIRTWTAVFVDAKTKKPLPGILVDADVSVVNAKKKQQRLLVSDKSGEVKIPLQKGDATFLNVRGPGWCYVSGWPVVGELPADWYEKGAPPAADPDKPVKIKLYRGTDVKGRLLFPDGRPAAGVSLSAGVHCNQAPWVSEEYIQNLMRTTLSDSAWPNWNAATTTNDDGTFNITVPPRSVRYWIRLGTIRGDWQAIDTSRIETSDKRHALVQFAPFELEVDGDKSEQKIDTASGVLDLGDLRLSKGVVLRGRVVDAEGRGMPDVELFTSSERGPYAGRKTMTKPDGSFEFRPMNAGTISLSPDAHLRDDKGKRKDSRDVAALFVDQKIKLSEDVNPQEIVIRALPHVELAFEWIDRRAKKGPVAYYGCFTLTGHVERPDGSKDWWRGETDKVTRDGKEMLVVKVPEAVTELTIGLHPDQLVTPSYTDDLEEHASGNILLGDPKRKTQRVIYGDEPKSKN